MIMPMVKARMGAHCKYYKIDKDLGGDALCTSPTYICVAYLLCDSFDAFQAGFGPHADENMGDISKLHRYRAGDPD
jgi:uncharacterized protein (TIGR02118 family)